MRIHPVQAGFFLVSDVNVSPICGIYNHSLDKDVGFSRIVCEEEAAIAAIALAFRRFTRNTA